jgi:hypothetical protein
VQECSSGSSLLADNDGYRRIIVRGDSSNCGFKYEQPEEGEVEEEGDYAYVNDENASPEHQQHTSGGARRSGGSGGSGGGRGNRNSGGGGTKTADAAEQQQMAGGFYKPMYSFSCLIGLALKNSGCGELTVSEIYAFLWLAFKIGGKIMTNNSV